MSVPSNSTMMRSAFNGTPVVAQANNTDDGVWCPCLLAMRFNQATNQGYASLRIQASFDEFCGPQQQQHAAVFLRLPVDHLAVEILRSDNAHQVPTVIRTHLDMAVPKAERGQQFLVLSLSVSTSGLVVVPQTNTAHLTPKPEHRGQVRAFQTLCSATKITVYAPKHSIQDSHAAVLSKFIDLVNCGELQPLPVDSSRLYGKSGARMAQADVFNTKSDDEPPPAYQPAERALGKRRRSAGKSCAAPTYIHDALLIPSAVYLVSPAASSPSSKSGPKRPLLTTSPAPAAGPSPPPPPLLETQTSLHNIIQTRVSETVQALLPGIVQSALRDAVPELLRQVVKQQLPAVVRSVLDADGTVARVVDDYMYDNDPLDGVVEIAQAHLDEAVEDGIIDVRVAKDGCLGEIKDAELMACERLATVTVPKENKIGNSSSSSSGGGGGGGGSDELLRFRPRRRLAAARCHYQTLPRPPPPPMQAKPDGDGDGDNKSDEDDGESSCTNLATDAYSSSSGTEQPKKLLQRQYNKKIDESGSTTEPDTDMYASSNTASTEVQYAQQRQDFRSGDDGDDEDEEGEEEE